MCDINLNFCRGSDNNIVITIDTEYPLEIEDIIARVCDELQDHDVAFDGDIINYSFFWLYDYQKNLYYDVNFMTNSIFFSFFHELQKNGHIVLHPLDKDEDKERIKEIKDFLEL
jgi:hypothetical protein